MTNKQFQSLCKPLLSSLPGYVMKRSLLFREPVGHILRGFSFEGSSFDKHTFYVTYFITPLYIPTNHLYFLFGDRLRMDNAGMWSINDTDLQGNLWETMRTQGVPFIESVETPAQLAETGEERLRQRDRYQDDPNALEAIAYSYILARDEDRARRIMRRLLAALNPGTVAWHGEIKQRIEQVQSLALDEAQLLLEKWECMTKSSLKLEE